MKHTKSPTVEDRYIGERIREARIALGMTQTELGELIGVSFQQVQKYENGVNRVNGARIERLVSALNRPLTYFFPSVTDIRATSDPLLSSMLASKDGQLLVRTFSRIVVPSDRRLVLDLTTRLAKEAT